MNEQALLIDLDDTLYDELSYVKSGFRIVSEAMSGNAKNFEEQIFSYMDMKLMQDGRGRIFDDTTEHFELTEWSEKIDSLVDLYRNHTPEITLFHGVKPMLKKLKKKWKLAIVTDGLPKMQKQKVKALGLDKIADSIVYCWECDAPKPDIKGYLFALKQLNVPKSKAVVIGDNPNHDVAAAASLGCQAVRIIGGRFSGIDNPPNDINVRNFSNFSDADKYLSSREIWF